MFHLLYTNYFNKNKIHIFVISTLVFVVLNVIENLIHYNIGRHHDDLSLSFVAPSQTDWLRIIAIMIVFAILQGIFTMTLSSRINANHS